MYAAGDHVPVHIKVVNEAAGGEPAVTGDPELGEALSVDTSGLTDANGVPTDAQAFTYQWRWEEEHGEPTTLIDATMTAGVSSTGNTFGYSPAVLRHAAFGFLHAWRNGLHDRLAASPGLAWN